MLLDMLAEAFARAERAGGSGFGGRKCFFYYSFGHMVLRTIIDGQRPRLRAPEAPLRGNMGEPRPAGAEHASLARALRRPGVPGHAVPSHRCHEMASCRQKRASNSTIMLPKAVAGRT